MAPCELLPPVDLQLALSTSGETYVCRKHHLVIGPSILLTWHTVQHANMVVQSELLVPR